MSLRPFFARFHEVEDGRPVFGCGSIGNSLSVIADKTLRASDPLTLRGSLSKGTWIAARGGPPKKFGIARWPGY